MAAGGKPASAPPGYSLLHIRVRAFTAFGDEAVDPRRDNGQRYRAELEHGITFCEVRIKKDELRSR